MRGAVKFLLDDETTKKRCQQTHQKHWEMFEISDPVLRLANILPKAQFGVNDLAKEEGAICSV